MSLLYIPSKEIGFFDISRRVAMSTKSQFEICGRGLQTCYLQIKWSFFTFRFFAVSFILISIVVIRTIKGGKSKI